MSTITRSYFIVNVTQKKCIKNKGKKFPKIENLKDFILPDDIVELIELKTENNSYYGLNYGKDQIYLVSKEKVNKTGDNFLTNKEKAIEWLNAKIHGTKPLFDLQCEGCDDVKEKDIHSLIETGKCWKCREIKKKEPKEETPQGESYALD